MSQPAPVVDAAADALAASLSQLSVESPAGVTLESLCAGIASGELRRIIVLTGAGISVSAGIPDFRTAGTGLYDNLAKYNLPRPEAVFSIDYFRRNPQPFFLLAKELYPSGKYRPTPTHLFLRVLEERKLLLRNFTQNIDGLELIGGLSSSKLIQAHGGFQKAGCIDCSLEHPEAFVKEHVFSDRIPRCSCGGLIKPRIVFFGEGLPREFGSAVASDFPQADLLIVLGTSLTVQPFASLIERVGANVPRILINNERVGEAELVDESQLRQHPQYQAMREQLNYLPAGSPMRPKLQAMIEQIRTRLISSAGGFDFASGKRDVFLQGGCDSGVRTLAKLMGAEVAARLDELIAEDLAQFPPANKDDVASSTSNLAQAIAGSAVAKAPAVVAAANVSVAAPPAVAAPSAVALAPSSAVTDSPPKSSPIAIGFDFDHTLGLDNGLELKAIQQYARQTFGVGEFDADRLHRAESALRTFRDGHCNGEGLMKQLGDLLDLSSEDRARLSLADYHETCYTLVDGTKPMEGALDLLAFLRERGVPTAILTNGWSPLQQRKVAQALGDLAPTHVLVSDQLKAIKPDVRAFDALAALPGFVDRPRSEIFFVGDNAAGDVGGALAAHMNGVWMDWEGLTYPPDQQRATHTVHSLMALRTLVEDLLRVAKL